MQKNVTNVLFSYLVTCENENFHRNTQLHQYAKTKGENHMSVSSPHGFAGWTCD